LTGYNTSVLYDDGCTLSAGNKTLFPAYFGYPVDPDWQTGSDLAYDNITNAIIPILTVYLPVANVERGGCCNQPKTVLECIRASNFSKGSRVATALAKGTPWSKSGALSAGAKGGVAAGVVVFVLAAGGILLYFWNTKRKKRAAAVLRSDAKTSSDDKMLPPEADAGFGVYELTPNDRKQELDGLVVSEMGGSGKASELANSSRLAELPAENYGRDR
jgi:hypothetical protein